MKIAIIGAGPSGLIAAKLLKGRIKGADITIYDAGTPLTPELERVPYPRWIHRDIGGEIGVHLNPVEVHETIQNFYPSQAANDWAYNTVGRLVKNHLWHFNERQRVSHWFESESMMDQLIEYCCAAGINFEQQHRLVKVHPADHDAVFQELGVSRTAWKHWDYMINTIPLPNFVRHCAAFNLLQGLNFDYSPMRVYSCDFTSKKTINGICQIIYNPSAAGGWVRFCNNRGFITIEMSCHSRGAPTNLPESYRRATDLSDESLSGYSVLEKRFILEDPAKIKAIITTLTDLYGIYQLGRFATWRYKLIHDTPADLEFIITSILEKENVRQLQANG